MAVVALKIERTPYTYILEWTKQGKRYIGARWAKNCHPDDLWTEYFTSSEYVREFVEKYGKPDLVLIDQIFVTPEEAMARELFLLRKYDIVNNAAFLNKGIQGVYNINDPDIRRRNSEARRGKKKDPISVRKTALANTGKKRTPETRERMSAAHIGNQNAKGSKHTPEWIAWVTEFHRTRPRSEETCERISKALTGKKLTPEHRANVGASRRGKPGTCKGRKYTPEHCANISRGKTGIRPREETRQRMSAAHKGRKYIRASCMFCHGEFGANVVTGAHGKFCPINPVRAA